MALAIVTMPAGCGGDGDGDPSNATGVVRGKVLAGPTCPVDQPGQDCAPTPVAGRVDLHRDGVIVAFASIANDGTFSLEALPGSGTLMVDTGDVPFPVCPGTDVTVKAGDSIEFFEGV